MSDSQNGQLNEEGTSAPMPSENKPAEETQPTIPDGVSERTAAEFEKLKAHNKALAEENASLKSQPKGSVLDEIRPQFAEDSQQNTNAQAVAEDFVDEGGYVDTARLNATLAQAKRQSDEARRIATQNAEQIQKFQETEQVRKAHAAFPQLDPNNPDFNPKFFDFTRNELVGQMMAGKQDLMEAAQKASEFFQSGSVQQAQAEKQQQTISKREQASATTSTSTGKSTSPTHDALVAGTIRGDNEAIGLRLQASGN